MLASDLRELVQVDVDEARTGYKSVEPRSWIVLLERIPTWAAILGPSAAVFLKELLKKAAKDTYWNKAAIGRAARVAQNDVFAIDATRKIAGGKEIDAGNLQARCRRNGAVN